MTVRRLARLRKSIYPNYSKPFEKWKSSAIYDLNQFFIIVEKIIQIENVTG
jgi:hypothetical protein